MSMMKVLTQGKEQCRAMKVQKANIEILFV